MAESVIQSSFAAGELSPNLFARVDLDKYQTGAARVENFFVDYRGGVSTRQGTALLDRAKGQVYSPRLIPFIFSQEQSYVLELGDFYMRFYSQGSQLLEGPVGITNITRGLPGVVTAPGHAYTTGNFVFISQVQGMTQINGGNYEVFVIDANNFFLADEDGNPLNTTAYSAYTAGGFVQRIYEIVTPWSYIDLPLLKFAQSADVMTFTHTLYPAQDLSRTGPTTFNLSPEVIGPSLPAPVVSSATPTTAGNLLYQYQICAVTANGERGTPSNIVACASAALNPTAATPVVIDVGWSAVATADHYDVFKTGPVFNTQPQPTYFGYIGSTTDTQFTDTNVAPDFTNGPPQFRNPFLGGNYAGCISYYQQRRAYGGLAFSPEEIDFSKTGAYLNFDVSFGVLDSDAIQIAIASRQVNEIKSMVPTATGFVILTTGGAFQVSGGTPLASITPSDISALPQASSGANDLPPIIVNYDILFVQSKGAIVRDLAYNFYTQSFYGYDRSALANHLFFGHKLLEWAWAEEPFKLVWVVRDDGIALTLTYVPEQQVYGWAQHYTTGLFLSVAVVPEGNEDAVYFIVKRPYKNKLVNYVERLASRHFIRVEDAWCVDCGVNTALNRPNFGFFMTGNSAEAFLQADTGTPFDPSWVGRIIWLDAGGKMQVNAYVSPSQIDCAILQLLGNEIPGTVDVFNQIQGGTWGWANEVTEVTIPAHLMGQTIVGLADGQVIGPFPPQVNNTINLPAPSSKIVLGFPYMCNVQTLDLDTGEPTIQGKRKEIAAITIRMDESRGLASGGRFDDLTEIKPDLANYSIPEPLFTGDKRITIAAGWTEEGQVCVQQKYPLPATVLGIIPEVVIGDDPTG